MQEAVETNESVQKNEGKQETEGNWAVPSNCFAQLLFNKGVVNLA